MRENLLFCLSGLFGNFRTASSDVGVNFDHPASSFDDPGDCHSDATLDDDVNNVSICTDYKQHLLLDTPGCQLVDATKCRTSFVNISRVRVTRNKIQTNSVRTLK